MTRVVILGAARQGTALARYLAAHGARVTLSDMNANVEIDETLRAFQAQGVLTLALGGHPLSLLDDCDVLCLSGGVPTDLPIVVEAKRRGVALSNDAQMFFELCPAPIIGITGSAGKTTTTTLVGEILREEERRTRLSRVFVGGNIGNPLIEEVENIRPSDKVVMELSSFQLDLMTRSPHIACITNITPNHLDRHGTMEAYTAAKKRILDFQSESDTQVLSADDPVTSQLNSKARTLWFSLQSEPHGEGAWMDADGNFRVRALSIDEIVCHRRELKLMGAHNILNVLAACAVSAVAGASVETMRQVATTFKGVSHRLQLVSERNGARWYDDSIATAPERLMAALRCFDSPVILLCGGRDKKLLWDEACALMLGRCKHILLFGEMGQMVGDKLEEVRSEELVGRSGRWAVNGRQWTVCGTLEAAIEEAKRTAKRGDVVLLSPGGTSYDAFKDFAERGDRFQELVNRDS